MGIVIHRHERDETQIGVWKVEESVEVLKKNLILNAEEIRFFSQLNKGKRNIHWLSGRVLLRKLLNTDQFIKVRGDVHGKPHLLNFDYHISISHSSDYAAVMLSKKRVGIDVEEIKDVILKVAPKFLSEKELSEVELTTDNIKKLYVYWCAKESVFKLNGKKQLLFREHIYINPFEWGEKGSVTAEIRQGKLQLDLNVFYEEFNKYMLTYVIDN